MATINFVFVVLFVVLFVDLVVDLDLVGGFRDRHRLRRGDLKAEQEGAQRTLPTLADVSEPSGGRCG